LRRARELSAPLLETLPGHRAVLRLVENTVAARLFGESLRTRHLDHCVGTAGVVPVVDLLAPDDLARLDAVLDLLRREVG